MSPRIEAWLAGGPHDGRTVEVDATCQEVTLGLSSEQQAAREALLARVFRPQPARPVLEHHYVRRPDGELVVPAVQGFRDGGETYEINPARVIAAYFDHQE